MVFKGIQKRKFRHFAAAATMLLRACGMPARYVVGYAAPASLFQGQEDGSYQAVLEDDNAHAWAEVYREGIGWTVVEATPGFAALVTESDGASGQKEKEADSPDTPGEAFYQEDTPEAETPGIGSRIFRVVKKALATVALLITVCGILAVIRRHILCKRRKRGRKGEAPGEQSKGFTKLCRSAEIQQKKCMQLSGGALCKAAWKEISGIFGEDSAESWQISC